MTAPASFIAASRDAAPFKRKRVDKLTLGDASVNVHYFDKEIIPIGVGSRKHPEAGYPIDVPPERADHWIQTFALMQERGHKVPGPPDHRDRNRSFGKWVALSRRPNAVGGESLYGELMVTGDATAEEVLNIGDVSIRTVAELRDDRGNVYRDAVEHIAVTPFPAMTGLSPFVPIAASRGPAGGEPEPEQVPVFDFSLTTAPQEPVMTLKDLRKVLGAADTVSDADVEALAVSKIAGIPDAVTAATAPIAAARDGLKVKLDAAELELTKRPAPRQAPNELSLSMMARSLKGEQRRLVAGGVLSDNAVKELDALFRDGAGNPNELALTIHAGSPDPVELRVYDILARDKGKAVAHGSQVDPAQRPAQPANPLSLNRDDPAVKAELEKEKAEAEAWRNKELEARGHATPKA